MLRLLCLGLLTLQVEVLGLAPPPSPQAISNQGYVLPQFDPNPSQRAQEVAINHAGYLYDPPLIGNSSYFPGGKLGTFRWGQDIKEFLGNAAFITNAIEEERIPVVEKITQAGGFKNLSSYESLYTGEWSKSNPVGIAPGYFTNYTQDLHFSMERLSVNPFSTARLSPKDVLPFTLDKIDVSKIAGLSLDQLHKSGRLFFASHSYQAQYKLQPNRYGAACDAYFYINPKSGDFLPLAIKTNVGSNLTYTPLDSPTDWLLAKMMFNSNDFLHSQIFHLANSHAVAEIVYLAALRTLSARHPVRAFLDRIMYQAYAVRVAGNQTLFNPGGFFDQTAAVDHTGVLSFVDQFYPSVAGLFRGNYLRESLVSRGMLDSPYGPKLKNVPFYEDAAPIVASLRRFVTSFITAYYTNPSYLTRDKEVQSWITEANGPANVLDFSPAPLTSIQTLIDILTQMAYLTGVNHHLLNSNAPSYITGLLPFHPSAFYKPLPTTKGVADVTPYLADLEHAMYQVTLQLRFQRPQFPAENFELVDMFSDSAFGKNGSALPPAVKKAAAGFKQEMEIIGGAIDAKGFDKRGLCQGMPFIWKVLDPRKIPFFLSV
ncbi:hypothetical protein ACLMJK_002798 [Lecanora helva]